MLQKPEVEYRQVNLTLPGMLLALLLSSHLFRIINRHRPPDKIPPVFEPPAGVPPYEYVFDFTGEVWSERSEEVRNRNSAPLPADILTLPYFREQIIVNLTCLTAKLIGEEAARHKVKAYVRIHQPYYKTIGKGPQDEKGEIEPWGTIGIWWHETIRILAAIEGSVSLLLIEGKQKNCH